MPPKHDRKTNKINVLREDGALNTKPEKVRDPNFNQSDFFDPLDAVQVKYEMLRRVEVEKQPVITVAEDYGISRPSFYQTRERFEESGILGLTPLKRGPRGRHKLRDDVMDFIMQRQVADQPIRARELAKTVLQQFGLKIHPRTIERAIREKKTLGKDSTQP